jgi:hypothetical protein
MGQRPVGDSRTTVGLLPDQPSRARQGGRILVNRPGLYARHRFTDRVEWTGQAFVDLIDVKSVPFAPARDHAIFTYDTWLTLWPHDKLRVYVGSNRTTFDNAKSLQRGITGTFANLSATFSRREDAPVGADQLGRLHGREHRTGGRRSERRVWNHEVVRGGATRPRFHERIPTTGTSTRTPITPTRSRCAPRRPPREATTSTATTASSTPIRGRPGDLGASSPGHLRRSSDRIELEELRLLQLRDGLGGASPGTALAGLAPSGSLGAAAA